MPRVLTLTDVINQLNNAAGPVIPLSPTEAITVFLGDNPNAGVHESQFALSQAQMLTPYDVAIIQDAGPVGYWRLNEFGNVLSAADQSFESGVGTWVASNAAAAQSTTQAKDGTHSLRLTATTTNAGATTGFYFATLPGLVYAGSAWVFSTVASKTFTAAISWYDSSATLISTTTSATVTGTLNAWTQVPFGGAAPSNAFYLKVTVTCTNSANTNIYYLDLVQLSQFGYDSSAYMGVTGYVKNSATGTSTNPGIIPSVSGPYNNPDGSTFSGACKFTTVNDKISIPNSTQLQISSNLTIEAWIKPTVALSGLVTDTYGIIAKTNDTSEYSLYIRGDGSVVFSQNGNTGLVVAAAGSLAGTNQWSHIVVVRQYGIRSITGYVNGAVKSSQSFFSPPPVTTNPVVIGANSSRNTLVGLTVGEVAIYNRSLTATQVANHYSWAGYGANAQVPVSSGYGLSYTATGGNIPAKYGQWGYFQYPVLPAPGNSGWDTGILYGTFVWS